MFRLLRLALFFCASVTMVRGLAEALPIPIEPLSFALGVVAAGFTGYAELQINEWWSTATRPYKPQTVKIKTEETPSHITSAASKARFFAGVTVGGSTYRLLSQLDPSMSQIVLILFSVVVGIVTFLGLMFLAALTNRPAPKAKKEFSVKS